MALEERGKTFEELTAAAGHRLVTALEAIAAGHYPARPETKNLCTMCAFTAVCRHPGGAVEEADSSVKETAEGFASVRATDRMEGSEPDV